MLIDTALISRLEELARLELSDGERQQLAGDLSNILKMVETLEELDTEGVEPLVYINNEVNVLRADEVRHQLPTADALRNAPDTDGTYFKVPKVIDL